MDTRRDFLKKTILLSGTAGFSTVVPASIKRAVAIDPVKGSTYLDAEHVVILMQENRSFDHCFGTLQGVRGFNDPRAIRLPNNNLVWLQSNEKGETYVPFRFDIKNTKATWMGSVPHARHTQVDANNYGKYDNWLPAKRVRDKKYADMPLTLGHYTREDIPFTYAMADAFTVCDQHFCSVMSSTDPNRIFFWTGTIREKQNGRSPARIRNDYPGLGTLKWDTFPERLQDNGISWKVYQNDITCGGGFTGEERAWLANFGCNPLEWFANYHVKFSSRYAPTLQRQLKILPNEIKTLEEKIQALSPDDAAVKKMQNAISKKKEILEHAKKDLSEWTLENYNKLSEKEKELFQRAFTINKGDKYYHDLTTLSYEENGEKRSLEIPRGDVLYQFRKDVETGKLPTVSWLVAPWKLIDHPSAPWYGSLYMSQILDILTKDPEVWKKTIFILTFDENDGYFDHIPPFVAPDPLNPETGKCSRGLNTDVEYVHSEDELREGIPRKLVRQAPVGLGFRVPMIIASPWSRGGRVCSEIFDHTSTLQFLEKFLNKKYGKNIKEDNISQWRRTISGDLTSAFRLYNAEKTEKLPFLKKNPFIEEIYNAKFRNPPSDFRPLSRQEIDQINNDPTASSLLPRQERGIRPSCALPYELYAEGMLADDKKNFELTFSVKNEIFGNASAGSPFNVYIPGKYASKDGESEHVGSRSYAVVAGDSITDLWPVHSFENDIYHLRVYGPNGFFREFRGTAADPRITVACKYERRKGLMKRLTGNISLELTNLDVPRHYSVEIIDNAYKNKTIRKVLGSGNRGTMIILDLVRSHGWYDFSVRVAGFKDFEKRYAGHVETGKSSFTDPVMGGMYL